MELYTSELPSGEREHSLTRNDKARGSAGCWACVWPQPPLEQPQAREEEDTAPAHCAQRILSRPRVVTTELLQQNPNSVGGWATTFRQKVKHEEETEISRMAGNP